MSATKTLALSLFVFGFAATPSARAEIVPISPPFVLATAAEDGEFSTYRSVPTATTTPTGYAVAWIEETWAPGGVLISSGIGGKRLDVPAGLDFFLEAPATVFPFRAETPQLAAAPNGSVRAFWGQHQTVQSLRFFADGTGLEEQPIAIEPADPQGQVIAVTAAATGDWTVVAWAEQINDPLPVSPPLFTARYRVQRFGAGGKDLSFVIPPLVPNDRVFTQAPAVAVDRLGRFMVAWIDNTSLFLQAYDALGAPRGAKQLISRRADEVAMTRLTDGRVAIAWAERISASVRRIRVAHHAMSGQRLGAPRFVANASWFKSPRLVALGNEVVLLWIDPGPSLQGAHLGANLGLRGAVATLVPRVFPLLPYSGGVGFGATSRGREILIAWPGALPAGERTRNPIEAQRFTVR